MKIVIAGGGIGGLVTALSLHRAGHDIEVHESVEEIRELGVGINVLPHAVKELTALDLLPALEQAGLQTAELSYWSKRGQPVWSEPRGRAAGYRWPQISIHRGTLQLLLLEAARRELGDARIHTGHHFDAYENSDGTIGARFVDRESGTTVTETESDLLVAADGIHSRARSLLYPHEGMPKWNGAIMWRGVTRANPYLTGRTMIMAGHERQKFVAYPIAESGDDGLQPINWIAEIRFDTTELTEREDWRTEGDTADFLPAFADWDFDWLDCPALIEGADVNYIWPMVDRDPVERWTDGRMTLLGDAAHPMYPIGSNGASQAIIDARVLAACLTTIDDPAQALLTYDGIRREATGRIVLANRKQGPEEVMTLVEQRAPDGYDDLDAVITPAEREAIALKYKQLAGFTIEGLNESPSLAESDHSS